MHRAALILLLAAASYANAEQDCPVRLSAERQSPLTLQSASEAASQNPSQGLHVTLSRTDAREIVSIDATLDGLSPDPTVLPVRARPARDLTKNFHLQRKTGEASLTSFDLWMSRAGVLRWVDVTSITYADGTSWRTSQPAVCRAIPSLFALVAAAPQ